MKNLTKKIALVALAFVFGTIIFYSCRREIQSSKSPNALSSDVEEIKTAFQKGNYDAKLYTKLNDTASLYMQPQWQYFTKDVTDSATSYYFYVTPAISVNGKVDKKQRIFASGTRQYLQVVKKPDGLQFLLLKYLVDQDRLQQLKKTKTVASYTESKGLFTTFTGNLFVTDLKTNGKQAFGVESSRFSVNSGLVINKSQLQTARLKSNETCVYEYYCEYYSVCSTNWFFTYTLSPNSCKCPTYGSNMVNFGQCTATGGCPLTDWTKNNETIFVRNCNANGNPPGYGTVVNGGSAPSMPQPPVIPSPNGLDCIRLEIGNKEVIVDGVDPAQQSERDQEYADAAIAFYSDITCTIPVAVNSTYKITWKVDIYSVYWGGSNFYNSATDVYNTSATTKISLGRLQTGFRNTFYDQSQGQILETNTYYYSLDDNVHFNIVGPLYY